MKETEQMKGLSVYEHGMSVRESYQSLILQLESGNFSELVVQEVYNLTKSFILPNEVVYKYQEFHDCGKPFCLIIDEEGKKHFPEHAKVSGDVWKSLYPESKDIYKLILKDMDFHTLKGIELEDLCKHRLAPTLYFTAWAEIISNSKMFGGVDSVSFKIKKKKLIQSGKKLINTYS